MNLVKSCKTVRAFLSPGAWVAVLVASIVVILIAALVVHHFLAAPQRAAQAEATATMANGRSQAGADAVAAVVADTQSANKIDARVKGSEDAIAQAAPADRDTVTLRELCRSPSAKRKPDCRVFNPTP